MYVGMRGRTTEQVCKTKDIVILKHMSCELVGWELHPADRVRVEGAERFLSYLPRCLYLRVDGARWIVDPKLGPGVFPLHPVQRTWELFIEPCRQLRRIVEDGSGRGGGQGREWMAEGKWQGVGGQRLRVEMTTGEGGEWKAIGGKVRNGRRSAEWARAEIQRRGRRSGARVSLGSQTSRARRS